MQEFDQNSHKTIIIQKSIKQFNKLESDKTNNRSGIKTQIRHKTKTKLQYPNKKLHDIKVKWEKRKEGKELLIQNSRFNLSIHKPDPESLHSSPLPLSLSKTTLTLIEIREWYGMGVELGILKCPDTSAL